MYIYKMSMYIMVVNKLRDENGTVVWTVEHSKVQAGETLRLILWLPPSREMEGLGSQTASANPLTGCICGIDPDSL